MNRSAICRNVKTCKKSRRIPSIWMEPAIPTHLRLWMWCFGFMKSAPKAMDRRLAPHPRKGDQTSEMNAKAWWNRSSHSPVVQTIPWSHACVLCVCLEQHIALFQLNIKLARRKHPSIRLSLKEKLRLEARADLGRMQAMERGFGGVFCWVGLDEIFWCAKISQKKLISQMCWAWGRGAPNPTREGRNTHKHAPKKPSAPRTICCLVFVCSNDCNERCAKSFLVLWAVVSCLVNALQVLEWFQGLSTSSILEFVLVLLVRSLPYTMVYRKGTCFEDLRAYVCVPSFACFCIFLHLSRADRESLYKNKGWPVILHMFLHVWARVQENWACVGHVLETARIQGLHAHAHNLSKVCMRMHISRFGTLHDVSVRTVHVLACVGPIYWYSWASIRIRRLVSKLSMRLHLMASIKSWG